MEIKIEPYNLKLGGLTGIKPYKKKIERRLSDLRDLFYRRDIVEEKLMKGENPKIYEVYEVPQEPIEGYLNVASTILYPGKIGDEYYFTKGHFHKRETASEVYIGLRGEGLILMQNREGEVRYLKITDNSCVFIPPGFAHRTINTGTQPLIFLAVYPSNAGHDYGSIAERGFHKIVVDRNGKPVIIDNPRRNRM